MTRRAPIVLSATALGLAATLGFNARHAEPAGSTAAIATTSARASTGAASGSSSSSRSPSASSATKTVTSDAESTPYGDVQLTVTVRSGKVKSVEAVQLPANDPRSVQINDFAGPQLQQSALSHADGTVDAVSGATFTSNGYAAALQSALDRAGVSASAQATGSA